MAHARVAANRSVNTGVRRRSAAQRRPSLRSSDHLFAATPHLPHLYPSGMVLRRGCRSTALR